MADPAPFAEEIPRTEENPRPATGRWLTAALWAIGIGLQFAVPLLRGKVSLSDDLYVTSFLAPWWVFVQVALLAGFLALAGRFVRAWSGRSRLLLALAAAAVFALLEPSLLTTLIDRSVPLANDPVRAALMWSTPLAFYLVPAGLVIYSWLQRDPRFTLPRALGSGLVFIGIASFPYTVWLGRLWYLYIRTSGGGSV